MADLLQEEHQDGDEGGSLLLQSEEGPRRSDEQLGVPVRHVVLEAMLGDDGLHGLSVRGHQVLRPGVLTSHFIPAQCSGGERGNRHSDSKRKGTSLWILSSLPFKVERLHATLLCNVQCNLETGILRLCRRTEHLRPSYRCRKRLYGCL